MDLIDKQHVTRLKHRQHSSQVTCLGDTRSADSSDLRMHFICQDIGERRLSKSRRTVKQHMIQCFISLQGCLDEDLQIFFQLVLPDIFIQTLGTKLFLVFTGSQFSCQYTFFITHCSASKLLFRKILHADPQILVDRQSRMLVHDLRGVVCFGRLPAKALQSFHGIHDLA